MDKKKLQVIESSFVTRRGLRDPFLYSSFISNAEVHAELDPISGDIAPRTHYLSLQNYVLSSMCSALWKDMEKGESKPKKAVKKDKLSPFVEEHLDECERREVLICSCLAHYSNPPLEVAAQPFSLNDTWTELQRIQAENERAFHLFFPNLYPVCKPTSSHIPWRGLEQLIKPFQISYHYDAPPPQALSALPASSASQASQAPLIVTNPTLKRVKPGDNTSVRSKTRKKCVGTLDE